MEMRMTDISKSENAPPQSKIGWLWLMPLLFGLSALILPLGFYVAYAWVHPRGHNCYDVLYPLKCHIVLVGTGTVGNFIDLALIILALLGVPVRQMMRKPAFRKWFPVALVNALVVMAVPMSESIMVAMGKIDCMCEGIMEPGECFCDSRISADDPIFKSHSATLPQPAP